MQNARDVCRSLYGNDAESALWSQHGHDLDEYIHFAACKQLQETGLQCPKCNLQTAIVETLQTRSADEGMSAFIVCKVCKYRNKIG